MVKVSRIRVTAVSPVRTFRLRMLEMPSTKAAMVALARATSARWIMSTFWRTLSITMPNLPSRYQMVPTEATSMKKPIRMMTGVWERWKAGCTSRSTR